tara:strand:+ start:63 stop:353 length:291 start_codon:yes stop_codon:yes gene_type:complete
MFADIQSRLDQIKLEIQDIVNSEDVAEALVEFYPDQGTHSNPATHIDEWNGWLDVDVMQSFDEIDNGLQNLQRVFDEAQTPPPAEEESEEEESIFE